MDSVERYKREVEQSAAMVHGYYNNQAPFQGNPAEIPTVPRDSETGEPMIPTKDVPFKFVELTMPNGKTYLGVLTPFECSNGPGQKFDCTPKQDPKARSW
jgi:hypothetical protein